ncbi:BMP family ABC transporter substrate-binding protein [Anthropogastromicrobium sp.]|uniref:BMP family lipoprotein n=1 Tax=Anthropogastromicrobium sp. TaxID=2981649 RepID=UPI0030799465
MRRKQLFAVLMAGSMAASLAACGKTDTKKTTAATEKKTEVATTEKKTEVATTEAKTEKATEKETEAATEKETEAATEAKTEEASSEEATEAKTEEVSSEEASSEEASSEDVSAQAETEEESSEVATEAKTEEASNEEVSIEEVSSEEASSEEASSEEVSSEEASSEEASSEEASSEEASSEEASSEEASSEEATEAKTEEASSEEASSEKASSEEASSEEETEAETEEDIDGTGFKIGMVTDVGGVNDGSFNQSAWEGLQRAGEAFGCEVKYIESKGDADYVPNIESFLDEDYDLIVCVGYMMADAVRDAAELYPDQKFAIIDDASNADLDNVTCMMFEQEQASYLVGLAAGYTTESNIVGFVTGAANETMNSFGYGYCAGVLDANPDATILQYNANNFGDASGGKTAVNTMVTKGADVVFHAAGGTGIGVIDGCKENKIWAIGVDSDQSPLAPETILTSALKRVDNACYDATKKTILGTLEGGVETYDLAAGGVDIAPTTDNLSKDVLEKIEDAKKDIIAGDLVVPKNQEEFEEKYGDVYELD